MCALAHSAGKVDVPATLERLLRLMNEAELAFLALPEALRFPNCLLTKSRVCDSGLVL